MRFAWRVGSSRAHSKQRSRCAVLRALTIGKAGGELRVHKPATTYRAAVHIGHRSDAWPSAKLPNGVIPNFMPSVGARTPSRGNRLAPTSSQGTVGMISMVIGIAVIALGAHLLSDAGVAQDSIGAQWIVPTVR
jgi:hypothetical protein